MQTYSDPNKHLKSGHDYAILTLHVPIPDQYFQQGLVKIARLPKKDMVLLNDQLYIAGYGKGDK